MFKLPFTSFSVTKLDLLHISRHILYTKAIIRKPFADSADDGHSKSSSQEWPKLDPLSLSGKKCPENCSDSISQQAEFKLNENDVKENFIKGSGPGGQSVNKSSNCVHLKHVPTGIIVKCHKSRSLLENRKLAWQMLYEKLEHLYKGEESKIGKEIQKKKKRLSEQKRRQRIREHAKSEPFVIQNDNPD